MVVDQSHGLELLSDDSSVEVTLHHPWDVEFVRFTSTWSVDEDSVLIDSRQVCGRSNAVSNETSLHVHILCLRRSDETISYANSTLES